MAEKKKIPVVVVLGHIDHGKSSLLEAIREDLKITSKEAGGITQHIGAYQVSYQGKKITFIDTPGHEAFSQMRSRGAKVADIALLVIDASEGVKEQTKEAIKFIKEAKISPVVVFSKMDLVGANPEIIKDQLKKLNILTEDRGGKVPVVETSAKTKEGIADLLEMIILVAEIENLKADFSKPPAGVVIESYLDKKMGPLATVLVSQGVLKKGQIIATSSTFGKIKTLFDFLGKRLNLAEPGTPALVLGFKEVPIIGEKFKIFPTLESAEEFVKKEKKKGIKIEEKLPQKEEVLNVILKSDCLGTLEATKEGLLRFVQEGKGIKIVKSEVGEVNESDIRLAKVSKALIVAFRVGVDKIAQKSAESFKVKILKFEVIYELFEKMRKLLEKKKEPKLERRKIGELEVLVIFKTQRKRQIIGGRVVEGRVENKSEVEVFRDKKFIGRGKVLNLQIQRKDVEIAEKGKECGILYEGEVKIRLKDKLKFYKMEEVE